MADRRKAAKDTNPEKLEEAYEESRRNAERFELIQVWLRDGVLNCRIRNKHTGQYFTLQDIKA